MASTLVLPFMFCLIPRAGGGGVLQHIADTYLTSRYRVADIYPFASEGDDPLVVV